MATSRATPRSDISPPPGRDVEWRVSWQGRVELTLSVEDFETFVVARTWFKARELARALPEVVAWGVDPKVEKRVP